MKMIIIMLALALLISCGENAIEPVAPILKPQLSVKVPEQIAIKQPVDVNVIGSDKVIITISKAWLYRGSHLGFYFMYFEGSITNLTNKPITLSASDFAIKINRKRADIVAAVLPDVVKSSTTAIFWLDTAEFIITEIVTYSIEVRV